MNLNTTCMALISICSTVSAQQIQWFQGDLTSAAENAVRDNKDILIYFWSETSEACGEFYRGQLQDQRVAEAAEPFLCYSVQLETDNGRSLFERYSITTMPSMVLVDPTDLNAQHAIIGSTNVPTVVRNLQLFARDEGTLRALLAGTESDPSDLDLRNRLADRYQQLGNTDLARELRASILTDDPDGKSAVAASMLLTEKIREIFGPAPKLQDHLVRRLSAYLMDVSPSPTLRTGWEYVAGVENSLNNWNGEFNAWKSAYPHVPDSGMFNWGWNRGHWWWSNWDVLSKSQREFAVEVVRKTVQVSERLSEEDPAYYDPGMFLTRRLHVLAMILYAHGEQQEAVELMERCVKLNPGREEFKTRLAAYQAKEDDDYFNAYSDYDASWAPDNRRIVFSSTRDRNSELYIADVRKGSVKRVTRSFAAEDHASFAAKGRGLVFRSDRFQTWGIYKSQVSGKNCEVQVPIIQGGLPVGSGFPSISSDDTSIALIRVHGGVPRVMVGSSHGNDLKPLNNLGQGDDSVAWAGKRIVYSSSRDNQKDIFIANPDGSNEQRLTRQADGAWESDVATSRNGKLVVFASWVEGQCDIWSIASNGEDLTRLTNSKTQDRRPNLSPNGKRIVFDRTGQDGVSRLWVMNVDGSDAKPLFK